MKNEGVRYISNTSGTTNKWSIAITDKGIYYIDTLNHDIMILDSGLRQTSNLSEGFGMKS
jgi:hypothetical protein